MPKNWCWLTRRCYRISPFLIRHWWHPCHLLSPLTPEWMCCATLWRLMSPLPPATFPMHLLKKWCNRCSATCRAAGVTARICRLGRKCTTPHVWQEWRLPMPLLASPIAAHALGGVFRVPHGRANALLMAHVVAWNADYHGQCDTLAARKYARLAHLLDLPASTPREGVTSLLVAIQTLKDEMNMPGGLTTPA